MSMATYVLAASAGDVLNVIAAFTGGLVIAGALVWAVRLGMKVMDQELPHPRPEEQPKLPVSGPVREIREMREPDEMPVAEDKRERLMPYQVHAAGTRRGKDQNRKRWLPGSSGSFGSGGVGHT
ncbi:DUF6479 family protein [Streptomyces sp. ALI-76-A]|jgi:hypothetical protein|uniref:DUF6479 family protein n=1 Tax=Streptomyces sp. ALI-76-A TaxID=3025736 RepID=UPI00256EB395|nr:DUF6479 family protein [Streptomyces sp. ALI-76-A]MDL5202744.1 DUF6479 family protein [Streptomyces sp. ALI-76-A]